MRRIMHRVSLLILIGSGMLSCSLNDNASLDGQPENPKPENALRPGQAPSPLPYGSYVWSEYSASSRQKYQYGAILDDTDPTQFLLVNEYPTDPSKDQSFLYSASFSIDFVDSGGRDVFYLVGSMQSSSGFIIERWAHKSKIAPIGGGAPKYYMKRAQLYAGSALGNIMTIAVSPDDSFLFILHGSPVTLSQMALPSGVPIQDIYDENTIPELRMNAPILWPELHRTEGIVWTLEESAPLPGLSNAGDRVMFRDFDQDGIIDAWSIVDRMTYERDYLESPDWITNYIDK